MPKGYGSGIAAAPKGDGGLLHVYPFPTPDKLAPSWWGDLFGANRGPRPSADGLESVDGLAAMHSKGHISGSIKSIHIFRSN